MDQTSNLFTSEKNVYNGKIMVVPEREKDHFSCEIGFNLFTSKLMQEKCGWDNGVFVQMRDCLLSIFQI